MKRNDGQPIPAINQHAVDTMGEIASVLEDVTDGTINVNGDRDALARALRVAMKSIQTNVVGANGTMIDTFNRNFNAEMDRIVAEADAEHDAAAEADEIAARRCR